MLCAYCQPAQGFSTKLQKLASCKLPSSALEYPTGFCIKASVAMMKYPDNQEPAKTPTADHQCAFGLRRFSPNRNNPMNADSRKKANMLSMASVCPMTPPANRENTAQLVPN